MGSYGWFPQAKFGQDKPVFFEKPTFSVWLIDKKLSQHNYQEMEWDPGFLSGPPSAEATFRVRQGHGTKAYMRVYMQVPYPSTELEPREVRREQAGPCPHLEVNALKCFHQKHATMTPALFGFKEELQGDDDVVPGGFIVYMVFQHVPGIRLANDQGAYDPEFPKPKFFREFKKRAERDKIRDEFDKNFPKLREMGWVPHGVWADRLVWDSASSKLWFIDFRKVVEADWLDKLPWRRHFPGQDFHTDSHTEEADPDHFLWESWGLGIPPSNPKLRGDLKEWIL